MPSDKIKRKDYEKLKEEFLSKNRRSMYAIYTDLNKKTKINKHIFFALINKICREEGMPEYYK